MTSSLTGGLVVSIVVAVIGYSVVLPDLGQQSRPEDVSGMTGDAERGAYVLRMSACIGCHTSSSADEEFLAGGPALETPFGTFYGPNITPDTEHGIGQMSTQAFFDSVTAGLRPDGSHYFPAFPYASYTRMTTQDVIDLKAYLDTIDPVARPSRTHDLSWPFSDRNLIGIWKQLGFTTRIIEADPAQSEQWNRGRYIVQGPGHCGECHTARNWLGLLTGTEHGGSKDGRFSSGAPGIAGPNSAISDWLEEDIVFYLESGLKPDGDVSGGKMSDVIEGATSHLTLDDLEAIAAYLVSLN